MWILDLTFQFSKPANHNSSFLILHIEPIYIIYVSNLHVHNGFSTISHRIIDSRYPSRSLVNTREYRIRSCRQRRILTLENNYWRTNVADDNCDKIRTVDRHTWPVALQWPKRKQKTRGGWKVSIEWISPFADHYSAQQLPTDGTATLMKVDTDFQRAKGWPRVFLYPIKIAPSSDRLSGFLHLDLLSRELESIRRYFSPEYRKLVNGQLFC